MTKGDRWIGGLVAFLEARLAEETHVAAKAGGRSWASDSGWLTLGSPDDGCIPIEGYVYNCDEMDSDAVGLHIACHDPARVLREVEAKRQVIEHNATLHDLANPAKHIDAAAEATYVLAAGASDHVLRLLAVSYVDHPDYREDWRPS